MSSTVTAEADAPRTIVLTNGQTITYTSNTATAAEHIPLIDVSRMYSERLEDRQALAQEIRESAHAVGFFYMINHVRIPYCQC